MNICILGKFTIVLEFSILFSESCFARGRTFLRSAAHNDRSPPSLARLGATLERRVGQARSWPPHTIAQCEISSAYDRRSPVAQGSKLVAMTTCRRPQIKGPSQSMAA